MTEFKVLMTHLKKNGIVIALLEKTIESPEKWIVAHNYDIASRSWGYGNYHRNLLDAAQAFVNAARD